MPITPNFTISPAAPGRGGEREKEREREEKRKTKANGENKRKRESLRGRKGVKDFH